MNEQDAQRQDDEIRAAKKGNAFLFGSNREIRRLREEYLAPDEKVLKIVTGSRLNQRGRGIVVATDRRVMFIWDGWVFREHQDFPYDTISSIEWKTGVFFGTLCVYGLGDETAYNWVGRFAGAKFTRLVRGYIHAAKGDRPGSSRN